VIYGVDFDIKNVETLPSLGGYTYGDYHTLLAKADEAAEGLRQGNVQIARRIGRDLGGNHRPAPPTFAGFSLSKDIAAAEASCTAAGLAWEKLDGGRFSCSRTPVDLGVPMSVQVTECKGTVLEVAVDAGSDGAEWRILTQRFVKLSKLLAETYGVPHQRDTAPLDDCTQEIDKCFSRGRARTSSIWIWPDGQSFRLVLDGGPAGGKPALTIVGDTRKSPQTPTECR
jgi:hypothetical protein